MTNKRKLKDQIRNSITYLASSISIIILIMIFGFVIITGKDALSLDMLKNDYWSQNYLVDFPTDAEITYIYDNELESNQAFSSKYGIVVEDAVNHEEEKQLIVAYVDKDSIFNQTTNATAGSNKDNSLLVAVGNQIEKLTLNNTSGDKISVGMVYSNSAKELTDALDNSDSIDSLYFKTQGGGIWGSLIATFKLIAISLLIALPLGVFTAIYLNEVSNKSKLSNAISYSIELLAGVPSIIFGIMGVIVLYPITSLFQIEGLSILLGALTMSVILLPIVIRSVQESLMVVPDGLRMASLSLGASKTQTIFKIILPSAMSGILSAILLAISRIIGESAALIYTMGTFINDSPKINQGATTLAVHIWSIMSQEQPNFELASAISIIILVIVLILNISVKYISRKLDRKLGY